MLNFKDKRACCLSNSGLRAERGRQQNSDVGFMKSKNRHLLQSGFFGGMILKIPRRCQLLTVYQRRIKASWVVGEDWRPREGALGR